MLIGQALINLLMTFLKESNVFLQMVASDRKTRQFSSWDIRELKVGAHVLANLCLETLLAIKYGQKVYLD